MKSMYLAATCLALFGACTVDAPDTSVTSQNEIGWNRLAGNRLAGNRLAGNRLAGNRLAGNSLSSNRLVALEETSQILSTFSGRIVYSYIVSCALPGVDANNLPLTIEKSGVIDEQCEANDPNSPGYDPTYTCTVGQPANDSYCDNGHCVFDGGVGIAADWQNHKLGPKDQGWESACLFARVNKFETAESISMRGRNSALAISGDEAQQYSVQEGAFFGNLFIDNPDPAAPPDWNACMGEGQASSESGGLNLRDCTEPNPDAPGLTMCGMKYAGHCRDLTNGIGEPYSCSGYSGGTDGYYMDCHGAAGNGKWPQTPKYREVVTTYVRP